MKRKTRVRASADSNCAWSQMALFYRCYGWERERKREREIEREVQEQDEDATDERRTRWRCWNLLQPWIQSYSRCGKNARTYISQRTRVVWQTAWDSDSIDLWLGVVGGGWDGSSVVGGWELYAATMRRRPAAFLLARYVRICLRMFI